MMEILSIGHSTLDYASFVARLKAEGVTAVADVRTSPYSSHQPHFSRSELKSALAWDAISYVFLGKELGGRPNQPDLYTDGVADYEKMARTRAFAEGLKRLEKGAQAYRVAMMCSEGSPFHCHRCLLVGRALKARGHTVRHIMPDHRSIDQGTIEAQLLDMAGKSESDMFSSLEDRLGEAYRRRALKVAYAENQHQGTDQFAFE